MTAKKHQQLLFSSFMLPGVIEICNRHIVMNREGMGVSRSTRRKVLEVYENDRC